MKKLTMAMVKKGTITEEELGEIFGGFVQKMGETFEKCGSTTDVFSTCKGNLDPENEEDKDLLINFGCMLDWVFKNMTTPAAYKWFINEFRKK